MSETNLQQQTLDVLNDDEQGQALEAVLFAAGYPMSYEKLGDNK